MLFNSLDFIFLFLPITTVFFFIFGIIYQRAGALWLALASLFFYGWWNPGYVTLLLASIFCNYVFGIAIVTTGRDPRKKYLSKWLLGVSVTLNILLISYYKYGVFFIDNVNAIFGSHYNMAEVALPIGISFFTFTQIAFLVDAYQRKADEYNLIHYGLFVTYYPHLIAGPILHHREMMPQFDNPDVYRINPINLSVGITIFSVGLFKKVILADGVGKFAGPVFQAAYRGIDPTFVEAWGAALAYTMQIYFDFSGYSDMAVGLSAMIGIKLPINFHSPYKSVNIIEFWRRWHMTLSRFLRDYLYIPLGGNRKGQRRRYINLMVTMLLGGLWHGASWTFVVWGGLHGIYLVINHGWHGVLRITRFGHLQLPFGRYASIVFTFLCVVIAWVFFRSNNIASALLMLKAMTGLNGFALPVEWLALSHWIGDALAGVGVPFTEDAVRAWGWGANELKWITALVFITWFFPNTQQIMSGFDPALSVPDSVDPGWMERKLKWRPNWIWALITATITLISVIAIITKGDAVSEFLYFQF